MKLVMGASGFLGSHVTRQLVARGDDVAVWVRPTSSTRAFDAMPVTIRTGELDDDDALVAAMQDVDTVFYCIVDARPNLYDPAPLFRTNVELLEHALDAAVKARVRFVFCSTVGTIGVSLEQGGPYIRSRIAAEELVLRYHREQGLDAVVLCPSTTFGPDDHGAVAHGALIKAAVSGRMPVYIRGQQLEVVGVEDAARAFLLAEERGVAGEKYVVSERMMSMRDISATAAAVGGHRAPRLGLPLAALKTVGWLGDVLSKVLRNDMPLTSVSVRLSYCMPTLDHSATTDDLGWVPQPTEDAIAAHARFFLEG